METNQKSIHFERQVAASPAEVYRAFTNAVALGEWFCDGTQLDPRQGGRFYVWWNAGHFASGLFTRLEPEKTVALSWRGQGEVHDTQVLVTLEEQDGGTLVSVSHSGMGQGDAWEHTIRAMSQGWESSLEVLQSVLETGEDIRFTRRPMMGIAGLNEVTPQMAEKDGLPVVYGLRMDGTVAGMGAEKAGLQKGDILTGMDGFAVTTWDSLAAILQRHRAGDVLEVEFYRGREKHLVQMELSRRPLPEVPSDPPELARRLEAIYAETGAELEKILEGVSEEQASHRPAEGEWNAKEVLAHLVAGERDRHNWIASLIWDQEMNVFADNEPTRLKAMVAAYQTAEALIGELKRSQEVTVAMITTLPPEFVAHKGSYYRIGLAVLDNFHARDHLEQIRAAISSGSSA